ncbi:radical SAM protein [Elusimicrobiota bacterium]
MTKYIDWSKVLLEFQKPGRYLGTEWNAYKCKNDTSKVLLCYPDDYSIGMSSLGFHMVCNIVNNSEGFSCERCFAPDPVMEEWMRKDEIKLFSLESKTPAAEFDIIGFSFQYELSYTNFINMLDLSGIEVQRKDRSIDAPLIIGGGPCCSNPGIIMDFLDIICIGEAEIILPVLLKLYREIPEREIFLKKAALLKGVFVPQENNAVEIAAAGELNNEYYPVDFPVSLVDIPHNRINIEINRGCKGSCRFCKAAVLYGPYRQRSRNDIIELAVKSVALTGHSEIALTSLSATDHSSLEHIMDDLHFSLRDLGVSVLMSSMKPSSFVEGLSDRMTRLKKGGITLAPECASERLKNILNKNVNNDEVVQAAMIAAKKGWKRIKLYFMIGIPGETMDDIYGIIDLIKEIKRKSQLDISATVNPLVPQPHTPFQWLVSQDPRELQYKYDVIKKNSPANVKKFNCNKYIIENILSRSGKDQSGVLYSAWKNGAKYDQWEEYFDFDRWIDALGENGYNWQDLYYRVFNIDDVLPWDFVETCIKKDYMKKSYTMVLENLFSENSRNVKLNTNIVK